MGGGGGGGGGQGKISYIRAVLEQMTKMDEHYERCKSCWARGKILFTLGDRLGRKKVSSVYSLGGCPASHRATAGSKILKRERGSNIKGRARSQLGKRKIVGNWNQGKCKWLCVNQVHDVINHARTQPKGVARLKSRGGVGGLKNRF